MALFFCLVELPCAYSQPPKLQLLRDDPRLQVKTSLKNVEQTLPNILLHLNKVTGLELTIHESLRGHDPELDMPIGFEIPAWSIMDLIALKQLDGGRWERTEKGYRLAAKRMLPAKKVPEKDWKTDPFYLRYDRRLRPTITIVSDQPDQVTLEQVLLEIHKATGLTFTLADNLKNHDPSFGIVNLPNTPCSIMLEMLAQKDLVDGRWEKTADGYHLVATKSLREKAPPPSRIPTWFTGAGILLLVLAGYGIWYYSHDKPNKLHAAS